MQSNQRIEYSRADSRLPSRLPEDRVERAVGVLGGMGPLASAEFLKTIYEFSITDCEQKAPIVLMYSDPTFPDRTQALMSGSGDELLKPLIRSLDRLLELGADRIVISCITIHYLLAKLPRSLAERIVSLLDVIFADVLRTRERRLLLCTNGTRKAQIFESHAQWEPARRDIVLPDDDDQMVIHDFIYRIKRNSSIDRHLPEIEALLAKHRVTSFIAGCTEMHLLAKYLMCSNGSNGNPRAYSCVDPLTIVAKQIAEGRI